MRLSNQRGQRQLLAQMRSASTYSKWREAALAHDTVTGAENWKQLERSRLYDHEAIRFRLQRLQKFREAEDYPGILYALDEGVHGNLGRMGNRELYNRSNVGTKVLVETYIEEVCQCLMILRDCPESILSTQERLDFFRRASACYGRSALLLSGGGVFGNFHLGVIRALLEQNLLPQIISGSSAGALIAAAVGSYPREQLMDLLTPENFLIASSKTSGSKSLGDMIFPRFEHRDIIAHIEKVLPDLTFAEAYQKTGVSINISVSPASQHQTSRLLNAITAPRVYIRSAVLASGSVPGIFPPAQLYAKDRSGNKQPYLPNRRWVDGSVSDDLPAQRLSRLYGTNHYIVSLVNPIAFITQPVNQPQNWRQDLSQFWHHSAKNAARTAQSITMKFSRRWPDFNHTINSAMSVLMQDYSGDINILPPPGVVKIWQGMRQPNVTYLADLLESGERATWPKIEMIRNCSAIGRTLDGILETIDPDGVGPFRHSRHPLEREHDLENVSRG